MNSFTDVWYVNHSNTIQNGVRVYGKDKLDKEQGFNQDVEYLCVITTKGFLHQQECHALPSTNLFSIISPTKYGSLGTFHFCEVMTQLMKVDFWALSSLICTFDTLKVIKAFPDARLQPNNSQPSQKPLTSPRTPISPWVQKSYPPYLVSPPYLPQQSQTGTPDTHNQTPCSM